MSKHKKCSVCDGSGRIVVEFLENNRTRTKDMKCENCNGTGFELKTENESGSNIIFPLDKKGK